MSVNRRLMVFERLIDGRSELPPWRLTLVWPKQDGCLPHAPSLQTSLPPSVHYHHLLFLLPDPSTPVRDTKVTCPPRRKRVGCLRMAHTLSPSGARWQER